MRIRSYITSVAIGVLLYGGASARTIQYDSGQWTTFESSDTAVSLTTDCPVCLITTGTTASSTSSGSASISVDGYNLNFSLIPGSSEGAVATAVGYNDGTVFPPAGIPSNLPSAGTVAYEFNWGNMPTDSTFGNANISEQVEIFIASPTSFDVSINYNDPSVDVGCGNESAVFSISPGGGGAGTSYSAHGACSVSTNDNVFEFSANQLINAVPGTSSIAGWTASGTTASAPEIDGKSGIAGLTLLLGVIAVTRGRAQVSRIVR
jgi:hypothetical protein